MTSVGIDVSKDKSTICIYNPEDNKKYKPFEVLHTVEDLNYLVKLINSFEDQVKVVMEATGVYHLPIMMFLVEHNIFVSVVNPLEMKKYSSRNIRKVKTDKKDSIMIANYGIDNWFKLQKYTIKNETYDELNLLEKQYLHYMTQHVCAVQEMLHMLDYTMPGISSCIISCDPIKNDKLGYFVEKYWHYDNIKSMSEKEFIEDFNKWTKEKGYHQNELKAHEIYELALKSIPSLPSKMPSLQMMVQEAVRVVREINTTLNKILARMTELAKTLPEYSVVKDMAGVGDKLAVRLIAEIGDINKFKNKESLIAYAGIDAPPYQSGKYTGLNRHISKRGSTTLRKTGFEVMICLKMHPTSYMNDNVYKYIIKKECEGKPKMVAKIAGLNKFLRIYYAKVKAVHKQVS